MSLTELIDFLRSRGITHYRTADLDLDLLPYTTPEEEDVPVDKSAESVKGVEVLGKDGFTAQEQFDTYGIVYDAKGKVRQ